MPEPKPILYRLEAADFDAVTRRFADRGYQQLAAYSELMARRQRAEAEHVAIQAQGKLIGAATVRIRSAPVLAAGLAYIAGGPLTRLDRADDHERLAACLDALHAEYVERRGLLLRVLGPVGPSGWIQRAGEVFGRAGFRAGSLPRRYHTSLLPLAGDDEMLGRCSKHWRRNLRRAERHGLELAHGEPRDLLPSIAELHERLRQRKGFDTAIAADFCAALVDRLDGDPMLGAVLVRLDGAPVAGFVSCTLGDTGVPLLVAADLDGLRSDAAYLVQWRSILDARDAGAAWYDLGGIDPSANPGVARFKRGLRGVEVWAPGPFQAAPGRAREALAESAERLFRRVHRPAEPAAAALQTPNDPAPATDNAAIVPVQFHVAAPAGPLPGLERQERQAA